MKTSKYIQLTILIFIFGTTLTLFINAKRYYKNPENKPGAYFASKSLDTLESKSSNNFSVIVVKEGGKISLRKDSINKIFSYYKHNGVHKEPYNFEEITLKNDTLFVNKVNPNYKITINTKSVKKIIGLENSVIKLISFHSDTLDINLTKSELNGGLKNNLINSFKITANKQSKINLYKYSTKTIDSITKERKFIPLYSSLKKAEITLKDKSTLSMPKPIQLIINADSLSMYQLYK